MIWLLTIAFAPAALIAEGKPFQALANLGLYIWAGAMLALLPTQPEAAVMLWLVALIHGLFAVSAARQEKRVAAVLAALEAAKAAD